MFLFWSKFQSRNSAIHLPKILDIIHMFVELQVQKCIERSVVHKKFIYSSSEYFGYCSNHLFVELQVQKCISSKVYKKDYSAVNKKLIYSPFRIFLDIICDKIKSANMDWIVELHEFVVELYIFMKLYSWQNEVQVQNCISKVIQ